MTERRITGADLIATLSAVLEEIAGQGVTYLVSLGPSDPSRPVISGLVTSTGEVVFALGPPDDLGRAFGLIDPEYGWPHPVQIGEITTIGDMTPGHRHHPLLFRGHECVAMSISWWEYEQVRTLVE